MIGFGDPVADAIGLLRPRVLLGPSVRGTGPWVASFEGFAHVKVGLVVRGRCWLTLQGRDPVVLDAGDFYLLGGPPPYLLAGSPDADPRGATSARDVAVDGVARIGPAADDETYVCDGQFAFEEVNASILTEVLPPCVVVRAADRFGDQLSLVSRLLVAEYEGDAVGGPLVVNHLGQILLVLMLRAHAHQVGRPVGWLGALNDDAVGSALCAMHGDVAHGWTLRELAGVSLMSRSAFAQAFKAQVGVAPLEYLTRWRMNLARDALRQGTSSVARIAAETGYGSESAFSTAFRRVVGSSPSEFRARARTSEESRTA